MKFLVLLGSPKGEEGVTFQFIRYIKKKYSGHQFESYSVCQDIKKIETDQELFCRIIDAVKNSDGVMWVFPVVFFLVHSNYKRFIELIRERTAEAAFKGKYTAALSTSIHIYDNTAHDYINAICDDLDMKYTGFFSASMDDIMQEQKRMQIETFAEKFFDAASNKVPTIKTFMPVKTDIIEYSPGKAPEKIDCKGKKILIISDCPDRNSNLGRMIERLQQFFGGNAKRLDVNEMNIMGGCRCCMHCGFDNDCIYGDSDDMKTLYNHEIKEADIIIFAARIVDRFFSARWKMFIDRRFINTHQPQMVNKQLCYVVSGPLSQNYTIKEIINAQVEVDLANLAGIVTDEYHDSTELDCLLDLLGNKLVHFSENEYIRPFTFLGIGARKILRDLIWGKGRVLFNGDYRFYKKNRMFDYPHKDIGMRIVNVILSALTKIPKVKRTIQKNTKTIMVSSLKKVLRAKS